MTRKSHFFLLFWILSALHSASAPHALAAETAGTVGRGSLKTKYPKFPQKVPLYDSNKMEDNFDDKTSTKVQICCPTSNSFMSERKIVTLINFILSYG